MANQMFVSLQTYKTSCVDDEQHISLLRKVFLLRNTFKFLPHSCVSWSRAFKVIELEVYSDYCLSFTLMSLLVAECDTRKSTTEGNTKIKKYFLCVTTVHHIWMIISSSNTTVQRTLTRQQLHLQVLVSGILIMICAAAYCYGMHFTRISFKHALRYLLLVSFK